MPNHVKHRIIILLFVPVLIFWALIGMAAHRQGQANLKAAEWVQHAYDVQHELASILSLSQDVWGSTRGYDITGQESHLGPFNDASRLIPEATQRLRGLIVDDSEQQKKLVLLANSLARQKEASSKMIELRRTSGKMVAVELAGNDTGNHPMADIRDVIAQMHAAEDQLLRRRTEELRASGVRTQRFLLSFTLAVGFLLLGAGYLVRRDLALRRRKLELVKQARDHAESIVDTVREPLLVLDSELRVDSANPSFYEAFRVTTKDTEGKSLFEIAGGQWNIPKLRRQLESILPQHNSLEAFEVEQEFPLIGRRTLLLNARTMYRVGNNTDTILLAIEDITERKRSEKETARLLAIIEESGDFIGSSDMQGNLRYHNRTARRMVGLPEDAELWGMKIQDMHPDWAAKLVMEEGIPTAWREGIWRKEVALLHRSGKEIPVSQVIIAHRNDAGNPEFLSTIMRDITDQKRAEAALRKLHQALQNRFDVAVRASGQLLYEWDARTNGVTYTNTEIALGYTHEEMAGGLAHWVELVHPDDRGAFNREIERCIQTKNPFHLEYRLRRKDGEYIYVDDRGYHILGEDGNVQSTVGFVMDISERKLAEESLVESEEKYRLLFERNPHPMWVYQVPSLRFLAVNQAAIDHYGYSRAEFLTMTLKDIRPPEDVPEMLISAQTNFGSIDRAGIWRHQTKDGRIIFVDITDCRLEFGGQAASLVLAVDVTEQKEAEQALRESEQRLSLLVASSPLGVIEWDTNFRVVGWNLAAEQIFGYSREEAIGRHAEDLVIPESAKQQVAQIWGQLLAQAGGTRSTNENRTKSGKLIKCEWYNAALVDGGGKVIGVASLVEDVSEKLKLEEQFRQAQKMEAVGVLSGGIAHDFNNLLNVIMGYGQLLLDDLPEGDARHRRVDQILRASERAVSLTRQLLAFSRKQVLDPKVLSLNAVVRDVEKMLRRLIGEDIDLISNFGAVKDTVKADPGQIEQILMNLAVNARDAMPNGGKITLETAEIDFDDDYAQTHFGAAGPYVMLAITDTGTGMDAGTRAHIFEPFFTTKPQGKGTGLGLSTVYGIVKQSGGYIWVYSEVGRGTTFKIYLPRVTAAARPVSAASPVVETARGYETVLVVEDDAPLREFACECLRKRGFEVRAAANGMEALALPGLAEIRLLITDVVMPGMSGRELAGQMVKVNPGVKILYVSGYTDNAIVHHGILDSGLAFLQKPYSANDLFAKAYELLRGESRSASMSQS